MARVMVVEDEPLTAADLEQKLLALGHAVTSVVDTGEDAVLLSAQQAPDLVLMDIRLRGVLSGIQAAQQIRARSDTPIVFLTAFADQETIDRACETQPFGYLVKPFTERAIATAVQVALTRARSEQMHLERERWMTAALRGAGEALMAVDTQAAIRFLNEHAEVLLQVRASEVIGAGVHTVVRFAPDEAGGAQDPLELALHEGRVTGSPSRELSVQGSPEAVRVAYSAAPVLTEHGNKAGAVLVFHVVARAATAGLGPKEAPSALPMRLSHEIRNPLTYNLVALGLALREVDHLRAISALKGAAPGAPQLGSQLSRIESLLRDAKDGAERIAQVMGELVALGPSEQLPSGPARVEDSPAHGDVPDHAYRGRVLVVDDEPMICRVLEITLAREHDVTAMTSASSALALLESGELFDVILCDVSMPGMNGRELYERLSIAKPELASRMIFMSGGATNEQDARFLDDMAARRVDKPFETERLLQLLRERVSRRDGSAAQARC